MFCSVHPRSTIINYILFAISHILPPTGSVAKGLGGWLVGDFSWVWLEHFINANGTHSLTRPGFPYCLWLRRDRAPLIELLFFGPSLFSLGVLKLVSWGYSLQGGWTTSQLPSINHVYSLLAPPLPLPCSFAAAGLG